MINLRNSRIFGTAIGTAALVGTLAFTSVAYARDGNGYALHPEAPNSVITFMTGNVSTAAPSPYQPGTDLRNDLIPALTVSPANPHSVQVLIAGRFGRPTPMSNQPYSASPVVNPKNPNSAAITMGIPQA